MSVDTLERIRTLREEIGWIRQTNREYLSRRQHTLTETAQRDKREARLVAIIEELASLTSKSLTLKR